MRSQSAVEYLTTYGWVIIIIAIVVLAFFYLGVFNANTYAPTLPPGSCQVYRPYGPGTSYSMRLTGLCNENPEYLFASHGINDYVVINSSSPRSLLNVQNSITITAWVAVTGNPYHDVVDKEGQYGMKLDYENSPHPCSPSGNPGWCLEWDTSADWNGVSYPIPAAGYNKFMFLAVSMDSSGNKYWYANGQLIGTELHTGGISYIASNVAIGTFSPDCTVCRSVGYGDAEWFNGAISNVQIYNTSLPQHTISALYQEGIGGAPIDLQNLVGWWPLDGNGNDYSGNNQNSVSNGITFTGGPWWSTYQTPTT